MDRKRNKVGREPTDESELKPREEHDITNERSVDVFGNPNSSLDKVNEDGTLIQRRYYDSEGKVEFDTDFTDHGNSKEHPIVPHVHTWDPK